MNDGKGVVFISHQGDVQPSGFLNLVGGNIRSESLVDIYQKSAYIFTCARLCADQREVWRVRI